MKNKINLLTIVCVGLFLVVACGKARTDNQSVGNVSVQNNVAPTDKTDIRDTDVQSGSGVTMENFNKIKTGMKYPEVVKILGSNGEVLSESNIGSTTTIMYKWDSETGWGANMNAMFQNGKLVSKSQMGLK